MAATISQRITLDAGDIQKQFAALGAAGVAAFKQIQDAAAKPIVDPGQIDRTKTSLNQLATTSQQLGASFANLGTAAQQFGTTGEQAANKVTGALQQTNQTAQTTGTGLVQAGQKAGQAGESASAGFLSAATKFKIAAAAIIAAISGITGALVKSAAQTGKTVSDQAEALGLSVEQWLELRKAIAATGGSVDDFASGASKANDQMKKAADTFSHFADQTVQVGDATVTIRRLIPAVTDVNSEAQKAAAGLKSAGLELRAIGGPDQMTRLLQLAKGIQNITNPTLQAQLGAKFFGDAWKDNIKALIDGKKAIDEAGSSLAGQGKINRELLPEQIEKGKQLTKAWEDLAAAVKATKDQIGALFLDSQLQKTEWLTKLVDGTRELFKQWSGLSDLKKPEFLETLGTGPAQTAFKILIALGNQLAGIWRDVLAPAGQQLMQAISFISAALGGIPETQVAAFFITAAAAALAFAVALKALGFLLGPISLLLSLFSPFGAILLAAGAAVIIFWDQIKAGAAAAAAAIPDELKQIQDAMKLLFAGDFAGAWDKFSAAAISAFEKIKTAAMETPWTRAIIDGLTEIASQVPATIGLIIGAFKLLAGAAQTVANILNFVFQTDQFTALGVVAIAVIGAMTGALAAMAAVATVIGVSFSIVVGTITTLIAFFGGATVAAAALGAAIGALVVWIGIWIDKNKEWIGLNIAAAWDAITTAIGNAATAVANFAAQLGSIAWDTISSLGVAAWDAVTGAIGRAIDAVLRFIGLKPSAPASGPDTSGGGDEGQFAGGGLIGGRGTGTSDSNLAWVSRGEHVMPAHAVQQPGVLAFLEALRLSGGNLQRVLDQMGRFALGGLVMPRAVPAFAAGGLVGSNNVTIQFPGLPPITGLRASFDTVDELRKAAALAQVRSGGRKPSRYS
jgi:hypothetical protein